MATKVFSQYLISVPIGLKYMMTIWNVNKRPDGLYSSAEILQKFANNIIWGGLIYKRESERINTPHC